MSKPQIIEPMRDFCERKHGKEVADKLFGPKQSPSNSTMDKDEFIAMKMLTRFKELRREDPKKPQPDIGWMLELLEVVRFHENNQNVL